MHATDRARITALALLGAATGTAAAGLGALAAGGLALCDHRVFIHANDPGMAGMVHHHAVAAASSAGGGLCPILVASAVLFAVCCVLIATALARRLVVAFVAALRLLAPGAGAPWPAASCRVPVAAGGWLARRRPSRAPPHRM